MPVWRQNRGKVLLRANDGCGSYQNGPRSRGWRYQMGDGMEGSRESRRKCVSVVSAVEFQANCKVYQDAFEANGPSFVGSIQAK